MTLKFNGWPRKTKGHLFYAMSSFVHYFKAIVNSNCSYSLETSNLGQNWWFSARMTLKFDGWPWKAIGHLFDAIGEFKLELVPNAQIGSKSAFFFVLCDLEILWITLKNNRAPLLCYFKLCVSFNSHRSIQTAVTVWKLQSRVTIPRLK